jgi:hypothetical protein
MALVAFFGSGQRSPDIAPSSVVMAFPARDLIFGDMFLVVEVAPFFPVPVVGVVCGNRILETGRSRDLLGLIARRFDNLI